MLGRVKQNHNSVVSINFVCVESRRDYEVEGGERKMSGHNESEK